VRHRTRVSIAAILVAAVILVASALTAETAWSAPAKQTALVGKVTRVSRSFRFMVVNGKVIHVTKRTVIHVTCGGLAGKRVRVVVVKRNGKYYAVDIRLEHVARH
jgi:hypothetical protein